MWEKGYQETDSVVSSVTAKAKGVTVTNTSALGFRIWDVADYVIPAQVGFTCDICPAVKLLISSFPIPDLAHLINEWHRQSSNITRAHTDHLSQEISAQGLTGNIQSAIFLQI